jgi:hypothetical protein
LDYTQSWPRMVILRLDHTQSWPRMVIIQSRHTQSWLRKVMPWFVIGHSSFGMTFRKELWKISVD